VFKWIAVRIMKKGNVPSMGADGLPRYRRKAVLGDDCSNKHGDFKLNYYWRTRERCSWKGPAPLGARQGLVDF
jgi:hypothetical protein